jgi:urease accessory protein UreF
MPEVAEPLPEGFSTLLRQIGWPDGFSAGTGLAPHCGIPAGNGLRDFLEGYQTQVLARLDMPVITRARWHAERGHARELIALDQEVDGGSIPPAFASASWRIGRAQLERLRPLRDERAAQRYLAAVEAGEAAGWHTVVYGITLAVYSRPLRQGLMTYARETLGGLAWGAGRAAGFEEAARLEILEELFPRLPAAIEETLAAWEEETKKAGQLRGEPSGCVK